jgi:hypothetical protein
MGRKYRLHLCVNSLLFKSKKSITNDFENDVKYSRQASMLIRKFLDETGFKLGKMGDVWFGFEEKKIMEGSVQNGCDIILHMKFWLDMKANDATDLRMKVLGMLEKGVHLLKEPELCTYKCWRLKRTFKVYTEAVYERG